jgi:hypothetical protein
MALATAKIRRHAPPTSEEEVRMARYADARDIGGMNVAAAADSLRSVAPSDLDLHEVPFDWEGRGGAGRDDAIADKQRQLTTTDVDLSAGQRHIDEFLASVRPAGDVVRQGIENYEFFGDEKARLADHVRGLPATPEVTYAYATHYNRITDLQVNAVRAVRAGVEHHTTETLELERRLGARQPRVAPRSPQQLAGVFMVDSPEDVDANPSAGRKNSNVTFSILNSVQFATKGINPMDYAAQYSPFVLGSEERFRGTIHFANMTSLTEASLDQQMTASQIKEAGILGHTKANAELLGLTDDVAALDVAQGRDIAALGRAQADVDHLRGRLGIYRRLQHALDDQTADGHRVVTDQVDDYLAPQPYADRPREDLVTTIPPNLRAEAADLWDDGHSYTEIVKTWRERHPGISLGAGVDAATEQERQFARTVLEPLPEQSVADRIDSLEREVAAAESIRVDLVANVVDNATLQERKISEITLKDPTMPIVPTIGKDDIDRGVAMQRSELIMAATGWGVASETAGLMIGAGGRWGRLRSAIEKLPKATGTPTDIVDNDNARHDQSSLDARKAVEQSDLHSQVVIRELNRTAGIAEQHGDAVDAAVEANGDTVARWQVADSNAQVRLDTVYSNAASDPQLRAYVDLLMEDTRQWQQPYLRAEYLEMQIKDAEAKGEVPPGTYHRLRGF